MPNSTQTSALPARSGAERARAVAEAQLRRTLLLHADETAQLADHGECAELALAAELPDLARVLYDLVFVRFGCALDDLPRMNMPALARKPMSDDPSTAHGMPGAIAELTALIGGIELAPLPQHVAGLFDDAAEARPARDILDALGLTVEAACTRLRAMLHAPGDQAALAELGTLLAALEPLGRTAPVELRDHVDAGLAELGALSALRGLQNFLRTNRALAYAPCGSPALLHAAARLGPAALGAYFGNLRHVVRTSGDILGMVGLAAPDIGDGGRAHWLALLATNLRRDILLDLVDDLADLGMRSALWALLAANVHRAALMPDLLFRIRDAGLDYGDDELAERAQAAVARAHVHNPLEWRILGDIRLTMGDRAGAESAFLRCQRYAPHDPPIVARLDALRDDRPGPFAVVGGLGTPRSLRMRRLARWAPPVTAPTVESRT